VAVTALHFYETKGLIKSNRNAGNQRRYPRDVLRRVVVIKIAQRLGIPLATIGEALQALPDGRTPTAKDWQRLSASWRADLDERINKLMLLRDKLNGCIGCGCLSLEACPLRNQATCSVSVGRGLSCWSPAEKPLPVGSVHLKPQEQRRALSPVMSLRLAPAAALMEERSACSLLPGQHLVGCPQATAGVAYSERAVPS